MSVPALLQHPSARVLPPGIVVDDVAERSRQALVAFLRLEHGAAERPELASWLFGSYLDALSVGRGSPAASRPSLVVDDAVPGESVAAMIAKATRSIEHVLALFQEDPDLSVAEHLVERGVVEPVVDEDGTSGYAPIGSAGMPLTVRVLSLAAVDMLTPQRSTVSGVAMRSRQTLPWRPAPDERTREPGWPARGPSLAELVAAQDAIAEETPEPRPPFCQARHVACVSGTAKGATS